MTTPKTKKTAARKKTAAKGKSRALTVADIILARQEELLVDWLENIQSLAGARTLELMNKGQLRVEATGLLRVLTTAFKAGQYIDIETSEFADSVAMLRDISASRAEQDESPGASPGSSGPPCDRGTKAWPESPTEPEMRSAGTFLVGGQTHWEETR